MDTTVDLAVWILPEFEKSNPQIWKPLHINGPAVLSDLLTSQLNP